MTIRKYCILLFLACTVTASHAQVGRYQLLRLPISILNVGQDVTREDALENDTLTILFDTHTGVLYELSIATFWGLSTDSTGYKVSYSKTKLPFSESWMGEEILMQIPPDYYLEETQKSEGINPRE